MISRTLLAAGSSRKIVSICSLIARNIGSPLHHLVGGSFLRLHLGSFRARRNRRQHLLFAHDQRGCVEAGYFKGVSVRDGIGGTRFHTIAAENASIAIDIIDLGIALPATYA